MLKFESAIVDELGVILYWCEDLSDAEIDEILSNHPEYRIDSIEIEELYDR